MEFINNRKSLRRCEKTWNMKIDEEKSFGKIEMRFSLFYVVGILMKV